MLFAYVPVGALKSCFRQSVQERMQQMAKQVLIIDDDQTAVKYLSAVLREHGYEPASASDGNEGLWKVKQAKPDLIVLDIMMPKKSGFVVLKQLKSDEKYGDIPVLMLTGATGLLEELDNREEEGAHRLHDSLREALRNELREMRQGGLLKPQMFVEKPVAPDAFIAKVQQLIGN